MANNVSSIEREAAAAAALDKKAAARLQLAEKHTPLAPPRMHEDGFPPLIRAITEAACSSSEAHPVAVAANVLIFFCAMIGRAVFQRIGDASIHCRVFLLIVGKSGKARKGTAETTVREVFRRADEIIRKRLGTSDRLRYHGGGLSTGEGVAWAIRDPREADDNGKGADTGIEDKRLLVIESEMDNSLSQVKRDNNTLSATIRNLFDGRDMEPLTKTNQIKATRPHVVIGGHITSHELREKTTANEVANGLLNRFMMLYVFRPKLVPLPEPTPEETLAGLAARVADAVLAANGGDLHGNNTREARLSAAARQLWIEQYPRLTRDRDGKGGSLLARSEMYARMLAMIFAAMDGRLEIEPRDLRSAIAWVEYWHASVTYIFNCEDDEGSLDPFISEVLAVITAQPGITLSALQDHWNRKRIKQVKHALEVLLNLAPPLAEERKDSASGGRPALRYYAYKKG